MFGNATCIQSVTQLSFEVVIVFIAPLLVNFSQVRQQRRVAEFLRRLQAQCANYIPLPFSEQRRFGSRIMPAGKLDECFATHFQINVVQGTKERLSQFGCIGIRLGAKPENSPTPHF